MWYLSYSLTVHKKALTTGTTDHQFLLKTSSTTETCKHKVMMIKS